MKLISAVNSGVFANLLPFEESGWDRSLEDGGVGCQTTNIPHPTRGSINIPVVEDRGCLNFIYGFVLTKGVPAAGGYPALPVTIISEYIHTDSQLDTEKPWLTTSGEMPKYTKMSMRFGLSNPEQFALIEPALIQLQNDMLPFQNLSVNSINYRSSIENGFDDIENFVENNYSGFSDSDFYSSTIVNDEVWFGSNGKVVVYNTRSDFFRTLGYEKGIPIKRIEFIESIDQKVYIASSNDLIVLDSKSKKIVNSPLSDLIKKNKNGKY